MWPMPWSRTCQWKLDWNSAPLSVWIFSTWNGSRERRGPKHPKSGAVVDRGVLVVALAAARSGGDRLNKLDVDLHVMTGPLLLVALPPSCVTLVALRSRQSIHSQPLEDSPHTRRADVDVVVALQVHPDLQRPEVVML